MVANSKMCKIGDIIVVDSYKDNNKILRRHSFIVIDDYIEESDFDIIIITDNL